MSAITSPRYTVSTAHLVALSDPSLCYTIYSFSPTRRTSPPPRHPAPIKSKPEIKGNDLPRRRDVAGLISGPALIGMSSSGWLVVIAMNAGLMDGSEIATERSRGGTAGGIFSLRPAWERLAARTRRPASQPSRSNLQRMRARGKRAPCRKHCPSAYLCVISCEPAARGY